MASVAGGSIYHLERGLWPGVLGFSPNSVTDVVGDISANVILPVPWFPYLSIPWLFHFLQNTPLSFLLISAFNETKTYNFGCTETSGLSSASRAQNAAQCNAESRCVLLPEANSPKWPQHPLLIK